MRVKPYLQLIRLPNIFTAAADSLAGWLLVEGSFRAPGQWVPLVVASALTYAGGIVLNDVFDFATDQVERPQRPLPSGQIGRGDAAVLGGALLLAGLIVAAVSATRYGLAVESALIGCVLAYDAGVKRTALGPEVMGACRCLNLLLGASHSAALGGPVMWLAAGSYALFVTGVTWVSRSEVHSGLRRNIAAGLALQTLAFCGLLVACAWSGALPNPAPHSPGRAMLGAAVLAALGWAVGGRTYRAYSDPTPVVIQRAVKFAILSLVWVHVGLLLSARGPIPAAAVALLWFPAAFAGRWIDST